MDFGSQKTQTFRNIPTTGVVSKVFAFRPIKNIILRISKWIENHIYWTILPNLVSICLIVVWKILNREKKLMAEDNNNDTDIGNKEMTIQRPLVKVNSELV